MMLCSIVPPFSKFWDRIFQVGKVIKFGPLTRWFKLWFAWEPSWVLYILFYSPHVWYKYIVCCMHAKAHVATLLVLSCLANRWLSFFLLLRDLMFGKQMTMAASHESRNISWSLVCVWCVTSSYGIKNLKMERTCWAPNHQVNSALAPSQHLYFTVQMRMHMHRTSALESVNSKLGFQR